MKKYFISLLLISISITQLLPISVYSLEELNPGEEIIIDNESHTTESENNEIVEQISPNITLSEKESTAPTDKGEIGVEVLDETSNEEVPSEQDTTTDEFVIEDGVLIAYNGTSSDVVIPEGVTKIGDQVFENNQTIRSVTFPDSLIEIGNQAFSNSALTGDLILPSNLKNIAFSFQNLSFDYVYVPKSITSSSFSAFSGSDIHLAEFEEGTTTIQHVFFGANVANFNLPDTVTRIADNSFNQNDALKSITLPSNLKEIGNGAFSNCSLLEKIVFPDGLKTIGSDAFSNCSSLKEVYLPSTLQDSDNSSSVFAFCDSLETVYIPDGVKTIPHGFFEQCSGIKSITIPETVEKIGAYAFYECDNLEIVIIPDSVTEIGENILLDSPNAAIVCNEESVAHNYALENDIPYSLEYHKHDFSEWIVIEEATCDKSGLERCTCLCGVYQDRVIEALGHEYSEDWTIDKEATCYEEGSRSHHCIRCDDYTDVEIIPKLDHSYSDWIVDKEATFFEEGHRYKECKWCKDKIEEILPKLEADLGKYPDYSLTEIQVVDAQTLALISDATVVISNDLNRFETTTDSSGKAKVFVPNGTYDFQISKVDYIDRSFTYQLQAGEVIMPQVGISKGALVSGNLSVREMTKEEMEAEGIDPDATGNGHVFRYETTIKFTDGLETYEIPSITFKNDRGETVKSYIGDESNEGSEYIVQTGQQKTKITKVSEHLYIIVQGETKWLKEIFHVQLLVINNSLTDELANCVAELNLPNGLSLADLISGSQSNRVEVGTVEVGGSTVVDWYIRGDKAGDYNFSATFTGQFSPLNEDFEYEFETQDPLHVYAGTDMNLTIHLSDAAYYGEPYTMIFELENVSDHDIYNVSHNIKNVSQYQVAEYVWVEDDVVVDREEAWNQLDSKELGSEGIIEKEVFSPGEKLAVLVKTDIMWMSPLNRMKQTASAFNTILKFGGISSKSLSVLLSAVSHVDVQYYLTDVMLSYAEGNTTQIPVTFDIEEHEGISVFDKSLQIMLEELIGKGENGLIKYIYGSDDINAYYSLFKLMNKQIQVETKDADTECIAWVESANESSDVISISAQNASVDGEGNLVFKGSTEISVNALNTGEAYLFVEDEEGNVVKQQFTVYEEFPGQEELASSLKDFVNFNYLILPYGEVMSQELSEMLGVLNYQVQYDGKKLEEGELIPTGSVVVDQDTSEVLSVIVPGDSNSDAKVNLFDGYHLIQSNDMNDSQKAASDFNGDDQLNEADMTYLYDFLTKETITTYSTSSVGIKESQIDIYSYVQDIDNIIGIQLDIPNINEQGLNNISVNSNYSADFNKVIYNSNDDYIRGIIANHESILNFDDGVITVHYDGNLSNLILPGKLYIQTTDGTIEKDVNIELKETSGSEDGDFEQISDNLIQELDKYEKILDEIEAKDEFDTTFYQEIQNIREQMERASTVEEIQKLFDELQNKYQEYIEMKESGSNPQNTPPTQNDGNEGNPGQSNDSGLQPVSEKEDEAQQADELDTASNYNVKLLTSLCIGSILAGSTLIIKKRKQK